jgi:chaperonin GroES
MAVNLSPLGDRVVLQARVRDEVTASGIVLPTATAEKPQEGTVLAVGPGRLLDSGERAAPEIKVGDTVLFARYSGTEIKLDGQEFLVMRESDLLAIVKPAKHDKSRTKKSTKHGKHSKK